MASKTMLATQPRHRPNSDAIRAGWQESGLGRWIRQAIAVCLEHDGLWHSYVAVHDTVKNSPGFFTVIDAMRDAEKRAQLHMQPG